MRLYARWPTTAVPCRQRTAQSPLWSHNGGATAATVGSGRSRGSRSSNSYQRMEPPSQLLVSPLQYAWPITPLYARWLATAVPCHHSTAVVVESQQRGNRRHGGCSRGSRSSYAYHRVESRSRFVWRKDTSIVFIERLAHTAFIYSLARDGRTTPLARSTVAVVESQRRDNHRHGGRRSLKAESPFVCISWG